MALDIASTQLLTYLTTHLQAPLASMSPVQARQAMTELRHLMPAGPGLHQVEDYELGPQGERFSVRVYKPGASTSATIVYYHGGGWVLMDVEDFDALGRLLAQESGCTVVMVNYRLAPEHPFPAARDDAWHALLWAESNRQLLTGRFDSALIVAGDSAGANLAALMAQRAARLKKPALALQVLIYPVTQPDLNTPAYLDPTNAGLLSREDMQWFWDHYLPDVDARLSPEVSPLLADRMDNLPATVMVTAEHDVLRAEGEQYAERLRAAGVPLQIRNFEGQMHGFFSMPQILPASESARQFVTDSIRSAVEL